MASLDSFKARKTLTAGGKTYTYYSLPDAEKNGLFAIDPKAVVKAHDFLLKYKVISKPVDLNTAFNASFLNSIPLADRLP